MRQGKIAQCVLMLLCYSSVCTIHAMFSPDDATIQGIYQEIVDFAYSGRAPTNPIQPIIWSWSGMGDDPQKYSIPHSLEPLATYYSKIIDLIQIARSHLKKPSFSNYSWIFQKHQSIVPPDHEFAAQLKDECTYIARFASDLSSFPSYSDMKKGHWPLSYNDIFQRYRQARKKNYRVAAAFYFQKVSSYFHLAWLLKKGKTTQILPLEIRRNILLFLSPSSL
jgi:hypothetical protein